MYGTASSINTYPTVGGEPQKYTNLGALSNDGQTAYTYDNLNRLTTVSKGGASVGFIYDANDRMVMKSTGTDDTQYLYAGTERLADYKGGALDNRYISGPGGGVVLSVDSVGSKSFYHENLEGSVVARSTSSGAVTSKVSYTPFGESKELSDTTIGYKGERNDEETGLTSDAGGKALMTSRGRALTDTTGGSIGFGNDSGVNSQHTPGPTPTGTPGAWGGISGLSPAGPDPRNPMFAFTPRPPEGNSGDPIRIPLFLDPTMKDRGGAGTDRRQLIKELLELFKDWTVGDAER